MGNNRFKFLCIYCKESHKDKNTQSYHRMFNLCKGYMGEQPLKTYPTWEPSNHGEKSRIAAKYGKVSSPTTSHSPSPVVVPPPIYLDHHPVLYTPFSNALQNSVIQLENASCRTWWCPLKILFIPWGADIATCQLTFPAYHPPQGLQPCSEGNTQNPQVSLIL